MALMRRNSNFFPSLPSVMSDFLNDDLVDWSNFQGRNAFPATNISENDNEFLVELAVPGLRKEDIKVNVNKGILTVSSERSEEKTHDGDGKYSRKEFSYQSFQRSFTLPENILESEKINAKYNDGVLCITLPKKEESKQKPQISREISVV